MGAKSSLSYEVSTGDRYEKSVNERRGPDPEPRRVYCIDNR